MPLGFLSNFLRTILSSSSAKSTRSLKRSIENNCDFAGDLHDAWAHCRCVAVPNVVKSLDDQYMTSSMPLHVMCRHSSSATIAPLPNVDNAPPPPPHIVALSMTDGSLAFIQQDAFKHHDIQALDFSNNQIQTVNVNAFRGLEMKLTQLDLSNNNMSVIPTWALTYLHNLQFLHLQNNRIDTVRSNTFDETQLNNLQFLHLDHNQLKVIPNLAFHRLRLIVLTMSNNRISEIHKMSLPATLNFIDLRNNVLTQSLDLEGNNITVLVNDPEVVFKSEIKVVLRNNKIRRLDSSSFRSFRKIKELDLSYNQISAIDESAFETVSQLKILDLSYNHVAHLPRGVLKNFAKTLTHLNLEENVIHAMPDGLRDLYNLTHVNLNGNKLNKIDSGVLSGSKGSLTELLIANNHLRHIPNSALSGMQKLEHLDISKNRIHSLERNSFDTATGADTSLTRLNLAGNKIRNITDPNVFGQISSLTYLDLSFNKIELLASRVFEKLKGLESLFLQNNRLKNFPASSVYRLEKLRHLMLDNNEIAKMDNFSLADLPRLQHLSLAANKMEVITENMFSASSSRELKSLNLAHNRINTISNRAFQDLENLQQLRLNNNHLRTLSAMVFSNLRNLRYLDLSHNKIVKILPSAFHQLPALDVLYLQHNNLVEIDRDAFRGTTGLHSLHLSNNALREFSYATEIEEVDLSHNGLIEVENDAFSECRKLAAISIAHNYIRNLWKGTFIYQQTLHVLDISHNDILFLHQGTFGKNNVLELLAAGNKLSRVPIEALSTTNSALNRLDLSSNKIKIVESSQLTGFKNLTYLSFAQNRVDSVEEGAFEHLTSLKTLDLSNNPVTSWSPTAFRDLSHSIISVNVANTGLFSIPKFSHRSLQSLNISHNKIYEMSDRDMAPLAKLVSLDMSYNNVKVIEPDVFQQLLHLKNLNISANPISHIHDEHIDRLYQLETLHISKMPALLRLPEAHTFAQLNNLKNLQLYDIPNEAKPFDVARILYHLPPLHSLHIEIKQDRLDHQLVAADTRLLRQLAITGKNLTSIDVGAFANIRGYRVHISLEGTSVAHWAPLIFDTLTGISLLSLSLVNNKLTSVNPFRSTIPPVVNQHGTILQSIELRDNPINCNCSMRWAGDYMRVTSFLSSTSKSYDFDQKTVESCRKSICVGRRLS
ncbi:unnamed protein product [Caenorhabditis auriculariae]|uniref:LRRCT domain-containing protein n=1 Tax=Caenorhabditis auriculariae TaxID=2777116 RepID=A0A8S1I0G0_9PELO|nr:unnamed protein product [Caenorhabditis auriculariae]